MAKPASIQAFVHRISADLLDLEHQLAPVMRAKRADAQPVIGEPARFKTGDQGAVRRAVPATRVDEDAGTHAITTMDRNAIAQAP